MHFARFASCLGRLVMFSIVEECGSPSPSKAVEKLKAHARSDSHNHATATLLTAKRAVKDGTVVLQLVNVEAQKRAQNRAALKCLILLTHFLTKEHVAHSTGKFEKLVDVVV